MKKHFVITLGFLLLPAVVAAQEADDRKGSDFVQLNRRILTGFFQKHCVSCHGAKKQEGDLRLDTLSQNLATSAVAQRWQEVVDALNLGQMPPKGKPRPANDELEPVLEHLTDSLLLAKKRLSETGGEVMLRRINRREYRNTIEDLFGIRIPEELIPPNDIGEGYDTIGQSQQFSAFHFEGYFAAAEKIVQTAVRWAEQPRAETTTKSFEAETQNERMKKYVREYDEKMKRVTAGETNEQLGFNDDAARKIFISRYDLMAGGRRRYLEQPHIESGAYLDEEFFRVGLNPVVGYKIDPRGAYRIRVTGGVNGNQPPIRQFVELKADGSAIGQLRMTGTPEAPGTAEMKFRPVFDQERAWINLSENRTGGAGVQVFRRYAKQVGSGGPQAAIWLDRVEVEGPFYGEVSFFDQLYQEHLAGSPSDEGAQLLLTSFAKRAFRGQTPAPEFLERVQAVYRMTRENGSAEQEALVPALAMILSSPGFLYLLEEESSEEKTLSQLEFANRLSFFLWSRMPDDQLLAVAAEGRLHDAHVLRAQVNRMLGHPNRWALAEGFLGQWASLKRFAEIAIDDEQHPTFNDGLRLSARLEPQHFFDSLVGENLGIDQLIDSDFVVVNPLLANHYGLDCPGEGNEFQKVTLPPDSPRGGLLGQMAFLTMGSNGERSSPIIRGVLVAEKFLHKTIASPPANVPELASASDKPLAVKEIIEMHQRKAQCSSCHHKFDPIGFGLENFDLLGRWRDTEIVGNIGKKKGAGKVIPVRSSGAFPNGMTFHDVNEFRAGLLEQKDELARSIAEGLLSYGLGRHVEFSDLQAIDNILKTSERNEHRIGDLIFAIVSHPVFRRSDPIAMDSIQGKNAP